MMNEMQESMLSAAGQAADMQPQTDVNATADLQHGLDGLTRFGGMRLLKGLSRDIESFDPRRKAARQIFLSDPVFEESRQKLAVELDLWIEVLQQESSDPHVLCDHCAEEIRYVEDSIRDNLFTLREEIHDLEMAYRTLDTFFANSGKEKVDCLTLMNVNKNRLTDFNSEDVKAVQQELLRNYDTLNLKDSYSLLVMPGYIGSGVDLRTWADFVHHNKVMLLTDFEDSLSYDDLILRLDKAALQSAENIMSSVVMTCNYIMARRKSEYANEDEDFYIPASAAIAGRMSDTENIPISQGVAGMRYGVLNQTPSVRFDLLKSEIAYLMDKGVVPLVEVNGRVVAFSNATLNNGSIKGMSEYPVVRVFDWVCKVIQHFCNEESLVVWDSNVKAEMTDNLQAFLNKYKGPGQLYENYAIKNIQQDPMTKNVSVQIELKPFYAAKNFLIELTGKNVRSGMEWEQNIQF